MRFEVGKEVGSERLREHLLSRIDAIAAEMIGKFSATDTQERIYAQKYAEAKVVMSGGEPGPFIAAGAKLADKSPNAVALEIIAKHDEVQTKIGIIEARRVRAKAGVRNAKDTDVSAVGKTWLEMLRTTV